MRKNPIQIDCEYYEAVTSAKYDEALQALRGNGNIVNYIPSGIVKYPMPLAVLQATPPPVLSDNAKDLIIRLLPLNPQHNMLLWFLGRLPSFEKELSC